MADALPGVFDGSLGGLPQEGFELGEDLFDRVQVWRVGRQEEEPGAGLTDCATDSLAFVATEIVHDDDIARFQGWNEYLIDVSQKAPAIDRSIDHAGSIDPVRPQCRQESKRVPLAKWCLGKQAFAPLAPAMKASHIGLGPGLVDEDQLRRIELMLMPFPALTSPCDVRAILFAGVQAFF